MNFCTFGGALIGDADAVAVVRIEAVVLAGGCSENEEETCDVLSGGEKLSELLELDVCEGSGIQEEFSMEATLLIYWLSIALILWGKTNESGGNSFLLRLAMVSTPFGAIERDKIKLIQ